MKPQAIALVAALIGVLVRVLKSDRVASLPAWLSWVSKIPPKARPVIALVLGQISGALMAAAVPGVDMFEALKAGLVAGALAIAGHDVIVEWILGGSEPFAKPQVPEATEALAEPVRINPMAPAQPDPPPATRPGAYSEILPPAAPAPGAADSTQQPGMVEK